jgi:FolB domain-containing protein
MLILLMNGAMDTVHINQLALSCLLGETGDEPTREQPVFLDCTYEYERGEKSVCYNKVVDLIEHHLKTHRYVLIEEAAQKTAALVGEHLPVKHVKVELKKLGANKRARYISAIGEWRK